MNLNLSMREKIMLLVLGLVIIILFGAKLLIIPASSSLNTDTANLTKAKLSVLEANTQLVEAKSAPKSVEKAYNDAKNAASPLLPSLNKPSLHLWFLNLAQESGLTIQSITIGDPSPATPSFDSSASTQTSSESNITCNMDNYAKAYINGNAASSKPDSSESGTDEESDEPSPAAGDAMTASVELNMTGSYEGMETFLDTIEKTKRNIIISAFNCKTDSGVFTFDVTLQCYAAQKLDDSDTIFDWKEDNPEGKDDLM